jgi:UDP-N-acetylglucosamine:LPS N-acetylglucosamine transferase
MGAGLGFRQDGQHPGNEIDRMMGTGPLSKLSEDLDIAPRPENLSEPADQAVVQIPVRKRVLLIASGGGHWIELIRLSEAFRNCHCEFVSTAPNLVAPVGDQPVIKVTDGARDTLGALLGSFVELWRIVRSRRPDLVVSTGAAPGAIALCIARVYGIRTIWIDSVANSDTLSLSGRVVRHVADLCLTQWPDLAKRDPRLTYFGRVL